MSKVIWTKLGDFASVQKQKNKNHVTENAYSITQAGLVPTKSFFKEKTNITSSNTSGYYLVEKDWFVYSPSRIDVGSINYLKDEGPVIVSPIDVVFSIDKSLCLPAFLLNYFFTYDGKRNLLKNREGVEGMGRRNLPFEAIKTMLIPLPPLSEQERIVGILDTFTAAIDNLKEQIAQRRKQFEYYRDQLLDLEGKEGVEMKRLGEIGEVCMCKRILKEQTSISGEIPFFKISTFGGQADSYISRELYEEYKNKYSFPKKGDVLISAAGTIGRTVVFNGDDAYFQDSNIVWINNDERLVINSYLRYIYGIIEWKIDGGTIKRLYNYNLKNAVIPLPPLPEQQRIVSILDTFEASISNLEAQLAQREKQYEYYRNKLLTFD